LEAERRIRDDRLSRAIDETARTHGCRALEEAIRDRDRAVDELVLVKAAQQQALREIKGSLGEVRFRAVEHVLRRQRQPGARVPAVDRVRHLLLLPRDARSRR